MEPVVQAIAIAAGTFIVREIFVFFVFKRLDEFSTLRGDVAEALVYFADVYSNGPTASADAWKNAGDTLRRLAARVFAFQQKRTFIVGLWNVPTRDDLGKAGSNLIGLSNSRSATAIEFVPKKRRQIEEALYLSPAE